MATAATLLGQVPCVFWYIHDLRFFAMPKSFPADLNKQLMAFAEYDNNSNNNNNNNNNNNKNLL